MRLIQAYFYRKAKKLMQIYNDLDVTRMFDVFEIIFTYAKTKLKINMSAHRNGAFCCPYCGSSDVRQNKLYTSGTGTYMYYFCLNCKKYPRERLADKEHERAALV